jgi:hypothetical protein
MLGRIPDEEYIDSHAELPEFHDVTREHWAFYQIMEAFIPHAYDTDDGHEHWDDVDS